MPTSLISRTGVRSGAVGQGDGPVGLHRVHVDRLGLALHEQFSLWFDGDPVAEGAPRVLVDQDRPLDDLRMRLETSGEIDSVPNAGVGRAVLRARIPGDDLPRSDADPDLDLRLVQRRLLRVEEA